MTLEKINRVIWRLQEMLPFKVPDIYSNKQLHLAIGEECGTSDRTIRDITKQLKKYGLIVSDGLGTWRIGNSKSRAEAGYGEKQQELGTMRSGT